MIHRNAPALLAGFALTLLGTSPWAPAQWPAVAALALLAVSAGLALWLEHRSESLKAVAAVEGEARQVAEVRRLHEALEQLGAGHKRLQEEFEAFRREVTLGR